MIILAIDLGKFNSLLLSFRRSYENKTTEDTESTEKSLHSVFSVLSVVI